MRIRHISRVLASAITLVAVGAATTAVSAQELPGDQPLPGYVINLPPLAPVLVDGQPSTVHSGIHEHAGYRIELPPQWNGELVMWAHGYRGQGNVLTVDAPAFGLRQKLLDQGYAWAASSYYDNGFDIQAGVLSTKALADLFRSAIGRPDRVYIAGVSMGGYVIGRSLEQYPSFYDGAMPICGVLGDQTLLDFFLDYNLVAQALAGVPAHPVPADYLTNAVPQIQVALGITAINPFAPEPANDLGRQLRDITVNLTGGSRPGAEAAFAVWKDFLFSISVPASDGTRPSQQPGQLSTNLGTQYSPNSPVDVNAVVQRVAPENVKQRKLPTLTEVPQIAGRPTVPVLSLHGLGDMFVPFSMEQAYAADVAKHDRDHLLVQRAIRTTQHCEFSPAEIGTAWDDLTTWVRGGARPAGDNVTDPAAVATATYGCQFSDPLAWTAGLGTRRLYPACP